MCSICLEDYEHGDEICRTTHSLKKRNTEAEGQGTNDSSRDVCQHTFHLDCMMQWLMKSQSKGRCPLCRCTFVPMEEWEQNRSSFV